MDPIRWAWLTETRNGEWNLCGSGDTAHRKGKRNPVKKKRKEKNPSINTWSNLVARAPVARVLDERADRACSYMGIVEGRYGIQIYTHTHTHTLVHTHTNTDTHTLVDECSILEEYSIRLVSSILEEHSILDEYSIWLESSILDRHSIWFYLQYLMKIQYFDVEFKSTHTHTHW